MVRQFSDWSAVPAPPPSTVHANPMLGIGYKVASVAAFLAMSSLLKTNDTVPPGQLVFFRSFFAILPIVVLLAFRGELSEGLKTKRPLGHFVRGIVGVCGMGTSFFALTRLPLPDAIAIGYGMPLLIVVFGALFLKETVRLYRWGAVIVGIIGVGIIVSPRLEFLTGGGTMSDMAVGAISALLACCFGAFATILVSSLVQTERSATIVLYFSITCSLIALFTIPFGWIMPSPTQMLQLVLAGIAGGIGQILLTESYRHADVSVVAPFEYTSLLLSIGVGIVLFDEMPTSQMMIGSVIVVAAGLFIIYREHKLNIERRKSRESTPPGPV